MGGLPLRPAFPALESGQRPDGLPYPLLGHSELIETLEVEPEFGAGPEEVAEAQRGVASNGPLTIQDPGDAVGRHLQLARKLRGAHVERLEFFGQMLAVSSSVSSSK